MIQLAQANAVHIPLGDGVVSLCVTSPPFYGLRSYEGNQVLTWGGVAGCRHLWGSEQNGRKRDRQHLKELGARLGCGGGNKHSENGSATASGQFCQLCQAWRGAFGLEPTPDLFIEHLVEVFAEVRRVLAPDGLCFVNLGDSYASSGKSGTIDSKSPAFHGGGAYDDLKLGRAPSPPGIPAKNLCLIPQRAAIAFQRDGWWVRSFMPWPKNNALPESVRDRPTTAHEYWIMLSKSKQYFWDGEAVRTKTTGNLPWGKQTAGKRAQLGESQREWEKKELTRDERLAKYHPAGRNRRTTDTWLDGLDVMIDEQRRYLAHLEAIRDGSGMLTDPDGGAMALRFNTASFKGAHFATFPAKMIVPLVKAGSSERGVCPVCRMAWTRVIEKGNTAHDGKTETAYKKGSAANRLALLRQSAREKGGEYVNTSKTVGWTPTCKCKDADGNPHAPIPALVLDPFVGSGTTLQVARALNRDAIGLDLSRPYLAEQARERLGLAALDAWETGGTCQRCQGTQVDISLDPPPMENDEWLAWARAHPCPDCAGVTAGDLLGGGV